MGFFCQCLWYSCIHFKRRHLGKSKVFLFVLFQMFTTISHLYCLTCQDSGSCSCPLGITLCILKESLALKTSHRASCVHLYFRAWEEKGFKAEENMCLENSDLKSPPPPAVNLCVVHVFEIPCCWMFWGNLNWDLSCLEVIEKKRIPAHLCNLIYTAH